MTLDELLNEVLGSPGPCRCECWDCNHIGMHCGRTGCTWPRDIRLATE